MTYDLEQRLHIYLLALKRLKSMNEDFFLCHLLIEIVAENFNHKPGEGLIEYLFPEFKSLKPSDKFFCNEWWHPNDKESRIKCLEQCIKMCDEKLQNPQNYEINS